MFNILDNKITAIRYFHKVDTIYQHLLVEFLQYLKYDRSSGKAYTRNSLIYILHSFSKTMFYIKT